MKLNELHPCAFDFSELIFFTEDNFKKRPFIWLSSTHFLISLFENSRKKKLCSLHWLPVKFRVDFKILPLTPKAFLRSVGLVTWLTWFLLFKNTCAIISVQPAVLSERLKKVLVDRAFSSAAPEFMEQSSPSLRLDDNFECFKSLLETHLFRLAFDM